MMRNSGIKEMLYSCQKALCVYLRAEKVIEIMSLRTWHNQGHIFDVMMILTLEHFLSSLFPTKL